MQLFAVFFKKLKLVVRHFLLSFQTRFFTAHFPENPGKIVGYEGKHNIKPLETT